MAQNPTHQSVPDQVLAQGLTALAAWGTGIPLQDLTGQGEYCRLVDNLLYSYFRHCAVLRWVLKARCQRPPKPPLRDLLELGTCALLYLDNPPAPVWVDTCVRYAKRKFSKAEAGFTNAVLRNILRASPEKLLEQATQGPESVRLELGEVLTRRWGHLGAEARQSVAALCQTQAPMVVRSRLATPSTTTVPEQLEPIPAPEWAPNLRFWHCLSPADFLRSEAFAGGTYYIQDPSTTLAPAMLAAREGMRIADLCAAPGGKSLLLAEAVGTTGQVVCVDRSAHRMRQLRENTHDLPTIQLAVADALWAPFQPKTFDGVLLDVPCSNTGVIRRRPDVRWRFSEHSLRELVDLQRRILVAAAPLVRPGGRLVYSTCSIEPEENGSQVETFLAGAPDFTLETSRQLLPDAWHDGAFAACLVRDAD